MHNYVYKKMDAIERPLILALDKSFFDRVWAVCEFMHRLSLFLCIKKSVLFFSLCISGGLCIKNGKPLCFLHKRKGLVCLTETGFCTVCTALMMVVIYKYIYLYNTYKRGGCVFA